MPFHLALVRSFASGPLRGTCFGLRSIALLSSDAPSGDDVLLGSHAMSGTSAPSTGAPSGATAIGSGDVPEQPPTRRYRIKAILVACALFGLAGCAGTKQKFDNFQRGWRNAEVLSVGRAEQIDGSGYTDCRRDASPAETATSRYAVLSYRLGHRPHRHIVKLNTEAPVLPGDMVFANVEVCGLPIYPLASGPPSSR